MGDSAYPLRPWLLTPVSDPVTRQQRAYNRAAHKKSRCLIERTFGVWKMRFLCLHKYGGCLMFTPQKCVEVIIATAILHNICVKRQLPLVQTLDSIQEPEEDDDNPIPQFGVNEDGRGTRDNLIANFFRI